MYVDVIVFIVLLIVMLIWFKKFDSYIYAFGIIDILLRLLYFVKMNIDIPVINNILGYLPSSISGLVTKYTTGTLELILLWVIFFLYVLFLYHIIKFFAKKKK